MPALQLVFFMMSKRTLGTTKWTLRAPIIAAFLAVLGAIGCHGNGGGGGAGGTTTSSGGTGTGGTTDGSALVVGTVNGPLDFGPADVGTGLVTPQSPPDVFVVLLAPN